MHHHKEGLRSGTAIAALAMGFALAFAPGVFAQSPKVTFDIPAENAAKSLKDFARQADVQIMFPYDVAEKAIVPAIKGTYTRDEALALILEKSGLEVASQDGKTISLRVAPKNASGANRPEDVVEVVVTGTHIRGGNPTSPVHTVTRKDIEQSGYSNIGEVMRALPENFAGGQNPGVIAANASNTANGNGSNAATVNLRGLGTDATLVLINGHRMASDRSIQGSDISGVPLAAVQRIEVVPDGASALYGSDAVAGVVNIVMRKDYDGGRISARYGEATQGGGAEQTYSLLLGRAGANGYLLANLEYSDQSEIRAGERSATAGAPPEATLWRPQTRRSLYLGAGRKFSDAISLDADLIVNDRQSGYTSRSSSTTRLGLVENYTPGYSGSTTLAFNLSDDWRLKAVVSTSGSRNSNRTRVPSLNSFSLTTHANEVQYGEVIADGRLFKIPGGPVKAAFGIGRRKEGFRQNFPTSTSYVETSREIDYAFGEILAPLVTPSATRMGLNELELSLSGRVEDYADIGSASTPRIGLRYVPFGDLTIRATWGQSFKAPSFFQMYSASGLYLYPASAMGYSGSVPSATAILVYGGNDRLKPEESTSWTIGADYTPSVWPSVRLSATYFNVDYTNRVVQPVANLVAALSNPIYAPFIDQNPSGAAQSDLMASVPLFTNFASAPYDPAKVVAIVNNNYQNATSQRTEGVDLSYRQAIPVAGGQLDTFANLTWLTLHQQTLVTLPDVELSGLIFNPPHWKSRAGASYRKGPLSATIIVNYVGKSFDNLSTPQNAIGSWTAADTTLAYDFSGLSRAASGLTLTLSVSNLFDRDPPFALTPSRSHQGIYFDSTNSSIMGRFVSVTLTKAW